jgi:hypothetical protein
LFTLITFGIVPTFTEEEFGYSFSLSPPDREGERVPIQYSYRGRTTLGWIAVFGTFSPEASVFPFDPEHSSRFRERFALAILDHAESVATLTRKAHE